MSSEGDPITRADLDELKSRLLEAVETPPDANAICGACWRHLIVVWPLPGTCPHCGNRIMRIEPVESLLAKGEDR